MYFLLNYNLFIGQARIVQRLRSAQQHPSRPATDERRESRRRAPPQRRARVQPQDRSRSPLRPPPAGPSRPPGEDRGIPPSRRPWEVPIPGRSAALFHTARRLVDILSYLQERGEMRRPLPQVPPPPAPPAYFPPVQGRWQPGPSRRLPIENLPTRGITSQEEDQSCVICLAEYENGEQVTVLPCNHTFHRGCISTWLHSDPRCPLCRHHSLQ